MRAGFPRNFYNYIEAHYIEIMRRFCVIINPVGVSLQGNRYSVVLEQGFFWEQICFLNITIFLEKMRICGKGA